MRRMIVGFPRESSDRQPCELPLHEGANAQGPKNELSAWHHINQRAGCSGDLSTPSRHQPRKPPLAKIRPGSPAPATGPRTLAGVMLPPSELANIGAGGNTARSPASVQGRRQKAVGPPQYKSES